MGRYGDFAVITAVVLAAIQLMAPGIRVTLGRHARLARSFGGGVGIAYIFLQLFPEVDSVRGWLGQHVHLVTLLGFLVFYVLEAWLLARTQTGVIIRQASTGGDDAVDEWLFWFHLGIIWLYVAMVVFTLPDDIANDWDFALLTGMAIGIHLVFKDFALRRHTAKDHHDSGRLLLALAPLAGWLVREIAHPADAVSDIWVAGFAGVLIQSVFRDEIPATRRVLVVWLCLGVITFAAISVLE